jgi:hypothetical protein
MLLWGYRVLRLLESKNRVGQVVNHCLHSACSDRGERYGNAPALGDWHQGTSRAGTLREKLVLSKEALNVIIDNPGLLHKAGMASALNGDVLRPGDAFLQLKRC